MLSYREISEIINKNIEVIEGYGVKRIGVFGSLVRGEGGEGSDVDILVEFEEGEKTFDNYFDLKFFLEDSFNCEVDLVIKETLKEEIRDDILNEVIYAK
jgi:hypothetical protein